MLTRSFIVYDNLTQEQIARLSEMTEHKRKSEEEINRLAEDETMAEMLETMLTDTDAAQRIAEKVGRENRGILDKIVSFLKNLVKDLKEAYKGLSPESRIAAEVKESITTNEHIISLFSDVAAKAVENYNLQEEGQKNNTIDGEALHMSRNVNGQNVVWIENNLLKESNGIPTHRFVADYIAEHIGDFYTIIESGQKVYIGKDLPGEYTQSEYTKNLLKNKKGVLKAKNRAASNLGEIIEIATNRKWEKAKHSENKDAKYGMYRYNTKFGFPVYDHKGNISSANIYNAELIIRNASDGKKYLYDIVSIKKDTASSDWLTQRIARAAANATAQKGNVFSDTVAQHSDAVKPESMKSSRTATIGQDLTESPQFRRWFGDSVVTNPDGTPKVLYHQTNNDFTVFDTRHAGAGTSDNGTPFGIFMKSDDRNIGLRGDKQMALYASIQNPLTVNNREHLYRQISRLSEEYTSILKQRESLDSEYHKRLEDNEQDQMEYIKQWREQNPGVSSRQLYNDDAFKAMLDKDDTILDEWKAAGKKLETEAKSHRCKHRCLHKLNRIHHLGLDYPFG